jgi:hypothetical protein
MPSTWVVATVDSTVGAVRVSEKADYPQATLPKGVESFLPGEKVTLCAVDGTKFPATSPPVRIAVLAVTQSGNSWWAGGHLAG